MTKEYAFKDLTKFSVIEVPDGKEAGEFSEGTYTVYDTSKGTYSNPEELCISLLYEDSWGECDPYLETVTETEFNEAECKIVSIPDQSQQETIKSLDSLIVSLNKQATEIENTAKKAGLPYDIEILSDVESLAEWRSSRC